MNFFRLLVRIFVEIFKVRANRLGIIAIILWWILLVKGCTIPAGYREWFNFSWNEIVVVSSHPLKDLAYGLGYLCVAFSAMTIGIDGALLGFCLVAVMSQGLPAKGIVPSTILIENIGFLAGAIGLVILAKKIKKETGTPIREILALDYVFTTSFCAGIMAWFGPDITQGIPDIYMYLIVIFIIIGLLYKGYSTKVYENEEKNIIKSHKDKSKKELSYDIERKIGFGANMLPMAAIIGGLLGSSLGIGFAEMIRAYFDGYYFKKPKGERTLKMLSVLSIIVFSILMIDTVATSKNIYKGNILWDLTLNIILFGIPAVFFCGLQATKNREVTQEFAKYAFRPVLFFGLIGVLYKFYHNNVVNEFLTFFWDSSTNAEFIINHDVRIGLQLWLFVSLIIIIGVIALKNTRK